MSLIDKKKFVGILLLLLIATSAFGQSVLPVLPALPDPAAIRVIQLRPQKKRTMGFRIVAAPVRETGTTFKEVVTFKDQPFSANALGYAGAYGADIVSTKNRFDWCQRHYATMAGYQPDCFEGGIFFNGTRDTGRLAAAWGGLAVANIVVAHCWKHHVKNRVLNKLWPLGMDYQSVGHVRAAASNWGYPR